MAKQFEKVSDTELKVTQDVSVIETLSVIKKELADAKANMAHYIQMSNEELAKIQARIDINKAEIQAKIDAYEEKLAEAEKLGLSEDAEVVSNE